MNTVVFRGGAEAATLAALASSRSTLTAWFAFITLRCKAASAPRLLRLHVATTKSQPTARGSLLWSPRRKGPVPTKNVIDRLAHVSLTEGERYYLYLLLQSLRSPWRGPCLCHALPRAPVPGHTSCLLRYRRAARTLALLRGGTLSGLFATPAAPAGVADRPI